MLRDVIRAGVAFSHDPNTAAPYRVVNWTEGADTAAVTAGRGGRTYQCAAAAASRLVEVAPVLDMVEELVARFDAQPVDCEFAVTSMPDGSEQLWLLQVRPLVLDRPVQNEREQAERLRQIAEKVRRGMLPHPFVTGRRTAYGVMPDWNPAEIIGVRPKPLALSLYRELVTDSIWA